MEKMGKNAKMFFQYFFALVFAAASIEYLSTGFYFSGLFCFVFMIFPFFREKFVSKRGEVLFWTILVSMFVVLNFIAEYNESLR